MQGGTGYLDDRTFETVLRSTPLVSVDLIVMQEGKVLLGKRVNRPAKGYWFTLGGRIHKHEMIRDAITRIALDELGCVPEAEPEFLGVFEHLYDDAIYDGVATHYLNLGYRLQIASLEALPLVQHDAYRWFDTAELLGSEKVHRYVKDYFTKEKGTIPQS